MGEKLGGYVCDCCRKFIAMGRDAVKGELPRGVVVIYTSCEALGIKDQVSQVFCSDKCAKKVDKLFKYE